MNGVVKMISCPRLHLLALLLLAATACAGTGPGPEMQPASGSNVAIARALDAKSAAEAPRFGISEAELQETRVEMQKALRQGNSGSNAYAGLLRRDCVDAYEASGNLQATEGIDREAVLGMMRCSVILGG